MKIMRMVEELKVSKVYYFGIPHVKNRTTGQQTSNWVPNAYHKLGIELVQVEGQEVDSDIKKGVVLNPTGRGIYSLTQNATFLEKMQQGQIKDKDKLHYQDFWTPGIEAIYYAAQIEKIDLDIYASVLAQSVDEYDFTYVMREWMRPFELGIDKKLKGIFVANQKLKDLLVRAGFTSPIHVVGLPYNSQEVLQRVNLSEQNTANAIIYTSRLDWEKNPLFMLEIARLFLKLHPTWEWWVCSSLDGVRSNDPIANREIMRMIEKEPRFKFFGGLSKDQYYEKLNQAKIIFNCALQDWVSYTIIEATTLGCDITYPNFRGFPEFIPFNRLYKPFNVEDALIILESAMTKPISHPSIPYMSDLSALLMAYIVSYEVEREVNIWYEQQWVERLLDDVLK